MVHSIDGSAFRSMILNAAAAVELQKQAINELNVFPVPDGDTGTNMSMTLQVAAQDLKKTSETSVAKLASITSSALLRGARGNSGVILSLLFRGFSRVMKGQAECDGTLLAAALQDGVDAAYKAVMRPAEGTILTVSRMAAAEATEAAAQCDDIESVLSAALDAAKSALAETLEQNPVLKKANVVDAGGKGYVCILEGMLAAVQGQEIIVEAQSAGEDSVFTEFSTEDITFAFDTVFIVRKNGDPSLDPLRAYLSSIGDCLVIGEDDQTFKVHVHTNIPGDALTESQKYGTLELAKIENMRTQHDELAAGNTAQSTDDLDAVEKELEQSAAPEKPIGFVTVCAGDGLSAVFRDLGADAVVSGGQTMNPSTDDIFRQILRVPAETVFVLPNNKNIIMAAQQAAELTEDRTVIVLPTKTVPQGITAMLNFDPESDAASNEAAMNDAIAAVETMQITYAARDSSFDGYEIAKGDYLGLYNGTLVSTDRALDEVVSKLAQKTADAGKDFVTVYYGEDVTEADAEQVAAVFRAALPDADVSVLNGGQPVYYYLISAE